MNIRRQTARVAFSLVELLIVIAIIGILAALLLTALNRGVGLARRTYCGNNLRQIDHGMQMFVADKHFYPLIWEGYPHYTLWDTTLSRSELNVPSRTEKPPNYPMPGIWHCPAAYLPKGYDDYSDYGYNAYGMSAEKDTNTLGLGGHHLWFGSHHVEQNPAPPINESEVVSPSEMMALGDGFKGGNGVVQDCWYILWRTDVVLEEGNKRSYARYRGKANVVFCDGHLESPTLQFLFADTSDEALSRWNRDHLPHREKLSP
jgi:prepilin-type N-terminal cleavage/methylation domain-containing protein/prepilin-type processing-associated H-X9-DG protein